MSKLRGGAQAILGVAGCGATGRARCGRLASRDHSSPVRRVYQRHCRARSERSLRISASAPEAEHPRAWRVCAIRPIPSPATKCGGQRKGQGGRDASKATPTAFSAEPAICYHTRMMLTGTDIERTHCPDCGVEKPPQFRWAGCACREQDEAEVQLPANRPRRPLPRPPAGR
jgi:hypothetical protein